MSENSYLITLLQKENQTIIAYEVDDKGNYTGVSHTKSFFAKANSKWKFTVVPDKFHEDYWIHIIQSDHQTITVRDNASFHDYRAGILVSYPDDDKLTGIQAGNLDSGIYPETNYDVAVEEPHDRYKYLVVNQNCRIFATLARDLYNTTDYHKVTIKQISHQTIVFTYRNKKYYGDTIVENNEDYTVEVVPDPGYTSTSLIINGKTINSLKYTGKATEDLSITAAVQLQTSTDFTYLEFTFKEFNSNIERFNNSDGKLLVGTLQEIAEPDIETYKVSIIQSANQTIHVYVPRKNGGIDHTSSFTCLEGTKYEVEVVADNGYTAGIPNTKGGTVNSNITINASPATKSNVTITIIQSANQTIHVYTPQKSGGTDHTSTFTCPIGTTYEVEVIAASGYISGVLNISESGMFNNDMTINATDAIKAQIYMAKGSAPWYNSSWPDKDNVNNTDESISGQATVTCKGVTNMYNMFGRCSSITSLDLSNFDTSNVIRMSDVFYRCKSITSLNLSNFNTSKVDSMYYMFAFCPNLTSLDVSNFDTSNVTDMNGMFSGCSKLTSLDLSNFNTSNVTIMSHMFANCPNLTTLDLSNFDTSNVRDMWCMFANCFNLTTIKGVIDMKSCTKYEEMFNNCTKLKGVKIKNPPAGFNGAGLSSSQYTIVS